MDQFLRPASRTGFLEIWLSPCRLHLSLFLPLPPSPFQSEFPSGAGWLTMYTYLFWILRATQEGAQGWAASAIQVGAGGLTLMVQTSCLKVLLVFLLNQVIQPIFSTVSSNYTILS